MESLAESGGCAALDSKLARALRNIVAWTLGRSINVEQEKLASAEQLGRNGQERYVAA